MSDHGRPWGDDPGASGAPEEGAATGDHPPTSPYGAPIGPAVGPPPGPPLGPPPGPLTGPPTGPPPGPPTGPPTTPPLPGAYGATPPTPPPPGAYGAPPPGAVPPGPGFTPPPPGFEPAAIAYQYGGGPSQNPSQALLADPWRRIVGAFLDWLLLTLLLTPFTFAISFSRATSSTVGADPFDGLTADIGANLLVGAIGLAIQYLYHAGMVAWRGQTLGAMALKVKVVNLSDGQVPSFGTASMRWLPNAVTIVPCVGPLINLGIYIWALVNLWQNPLRQTPFDLVAHTVVIDA